jgi:hypothetical protein
MLASIRVNKAAVHRDMRISSSDFSAPFYFNILGKELIFDARQYTFAASVLWLFSASELDGALIGK